MKLNKLILAFWAIAALAFASCEPIPGGNNGPGGNQDTIPALETDTNATSITIAEAIELINGMQDGAQSTEKYKIRGIVASVKTKVADVPGKYTNINFTLKDETGSIDCFYTNYLNNEAFSSADQIPGAGSEIVVIAYLKKYVKETTTTPELYQGWIHKIINAVEPPSADNAKEVTIAEAIKIANELEKGAETAEFYKITGQVEKVLTADDKVAEYGNINLNVKDATGSIACYYTNYLNNAPFTSADQVPAAGATVCICGVIKSYVKNDAVTPEILNGWFISIDTTTVTPVDTTEPEAIKISVADFNAASVSTEVYYELTGVMSNLTSSTYGNFDITDATGTVYVYGLTEKFISKGNTNNDKSFSKLGLAAGDTVTIRGMRGAYNDKIEVVGAYFVSIKKGEGTPAGTTTSDTVRVAGAGVSPETIEFSANPFGLTEATTFKGKTPVLYVGEIEFVGDGSANTSSGVQISTDLYKMYKNTTLTLTAPANKNITSVVFTHSGDNYSAANITAADGTYDAATFTWTGSANAVSFSNTAQVRLSKIVVTYE